MTAEALNQFKVILADFQPRIDACVKRAIDGVDSSTLAPVPRTDEECDNGFERWLADWKERLGPAIQSEFEREFRDDLPSLAGRIGPKERVNSIVDDLVWPQVEAGLRRWAVLALAAAWASRNLPTTVTPGRPEWIDGAWHVHMRSGNQSEVLGDLVLDANGRIVRQPAHRPSGEVVSGGARS